MQTIIVPIDFSSVSLNAAYYAADMAKAIDARLILVHVVSIPISISEIPVPAETVNTLIADASKEADQIALKLRRHGQHNIEVSSIVLSGSFVIEIRHLTEQEPPFAVIMGIHGAGMGRWLLGSNAFAAMRDLKFPVIIVPATAQFKKPKKVALACDMRNVSESMPVNGIADFANLFDGHQLDVLYVSKQNEQKPETLPESKTLLNALAAFHPKIHFIVNNDSVAGLVEFIEAEKVDLLIVIPQKHNFLASIFHKSISNNITTHIRIPVIALHV